MGEVDYNTRLRDILKAGQFEKARVPTKEKAFAIRVEKQFSKELLFLLNSPRVL